MLPVHSTPVDVCLSRHAMGSTSLCVERLGPKVSKNAFFDDCAPKEAETADLSSGSPSLISVHLVPVAIAHWA